MNIKITRRRFIKSAGAALPIITGLKTADAKAIKLADPKPQRLVLWYEKPASQWVEALPIGNGRLGAMVFGGKDRSYSGDSRVRFRSGECLRGTCDNVAH